MDGNLDPESPRPPGETTRAGLGLAPGLGLGPARVIADVLQAGADGPPQLFDCALRPAPVT